MSVFITFEGGEGTGKTTLIKNIFQALRSSRPIVTTREPGGSLIAEAIRDVVLNPKYEGVTPHAEALLIAAARAQHLHEVILPALAEGKTVLCDRYLDSSLAYQAYARELGVPFILNINKLAVENMPDLTFYIDLDPKVGMDRISHRAKYDRLDQETDDFHLLVREGYLKVAAMYPERIVIINGNQPLENITEEVLTAIREQS
ncbi:MAG: dTMP kinase [Acholeplasmataceae bacterium]|nr:MAG: dTMP kinase [Acholeplasmataceae bacterium]